MSCGVTVTPSSAASLPCSFESINRSRLAAGSCDLDCSSVCSWAAPCVWLMWPADTSLEVRRISSSSRHESTCSRSLNSSLLIDWPSTEPTDARWSL